jgi:hypothetical protein
VHKKQLIRLLLTLTVAGVLLSFLLAGCKVVPPGDNNPPSETTPAEPVPPANEAPVIHYISAEHEVTPSSEIPVRCVATDADKDTLTYTWSATGGTINGEGSDIIWTAPETEGDYVITSTVTDGNDGETKDSVTVSVTPAPNHVPVISMVITIYGKDPVTVTPSMEPLKMKKNSSAVIKCTAEDPDGDEISFRWSATEGRIDGEGDTVTYYSTDPGDIAIIVTAIDSQGGQAKFTLYLNIPCCGSV